MLQEIVIKFVANAAQIEAASDGALYAARLWARELGTTPQSSRIDALGANAFEAIVCVDADLAPKCVMNKHGEIVRSIRIPNDGAPAKVDAPIAAVDVFANAPAFDPRTSGPIAPTAKPMPKPHARVKLPS